MAHKSVAAFSSALIPGADVAVGAGTAVGGTVVTVGGTGVAAGAEVSVAAGALCSGAPEPPHAARTNATSKMETKESRCFRFINILQK
ncbi:MAG: hypothetical protein DSY55_00965 [Clostridia bacterium]|nr:MAG: hypothetical protein DSY55_00965 [Clostridia bacterium]